MYIEKLHKNMEPRTDLAIKACMPPLAKEKGELWFGASKGRKLIHMEIEKQMFGK